MEKEDSGFLIKMAIFRITNVGKCSIFDGITKTNCCKGIGVNYLKKEIKCNNTIIPLHLWITANQERIRSKLPLNDKIPGYIFVYDITKIQSFEFISSHLKLLDNIKDNDEHVLILIGNKCDLEQHRESLLKKEKNLRQLIIYHSLKLVHLII